MPCVCEKLIFCKKCYSEMYYKLNRKSILEYQKIKYKEKIREKNKWLIKQGKFIVTFD